MRNAIIFISSILACAVLMAAPEDISLSWDYPESERTNVVFRVYSSTNVTIPLSQWKVMTNVTATNFVRLKVVPGVNYFTMTASNFWGESTFSEVVSTPALPRSDVNLKVQKQ